MGFKYQFFAKLGTLAVRQTTTEHKYFNQSYSLYLNKNIVTNQFKDLIKNAYSAFNSTSQDLQSGLLSYGFLIQFIKVLILF